MDYFPKRKYSFLSAHRSRKNAGWRGASLFLITAVSFYFFLFGHCLAKASSSDVSAGYIQPQDYQETILGLIAKSQSSINVYMYIINLDPKLSNLPQDKLLDALISAHKRGLKVEVVLDKDKSRYNKNALAYKKLKDGGVSVFWDSVDTALHSKLVIFDRRWVVIGSTNWTESALQLNTESSCLIDSPSLAGKIIESMDKIKVIENDSSGASDTNIPLPRGLLDRKDAIMPLVSNRAKLAFDLYLLSLYEFSGKKKDEILLTTEEIQRVLGKSNSSSITYALKALDETYSLIDFLGRKEGSFRLRLLDLEDKNKPYSLPLTFYFPLPSRFINYGWLKRLRLSEEAAYLICLYEEVREGRLNQGWWSFSRDVLAREFHLNKSTIQEGMNGLYEWDLIEIERGKRLESGTQWPNRYRLKTLYDPKERKVVWENLRKIYTSQRVKRIRSSAALIQSQNNPEAIRTLLELEDKYGQRALKDAFKYIRQYHPASRKRSLRYIRGILEKKETLVNAR